MKWKAEIEPYSVKIVNAAGEPVAQVSKTYYLERARSREAIEITNLIASAPEMLHALEAVQKATQGWVMCGEFWDAMFLVSSVVKQAKGEGG